MLTLNSSTFPTTQSSSPLLLVLFGAPWCAPCKALKPLVEQLPSEQAPGLQTAYVDVDENVDLANAEKVTSLPTLILYKNGKELKRAQGLMPKAKLLSFVA